MQLRGISQLVMSSLKNIKISIVIVNISAFSTFIAELSRESSFQITFCIQNNSIQCSFFSATEEELFITHFSLKYSLALLNCKTNHQHVCMALTNGKEAENRLPSYIFVFFMLYARAYFFRISFCVLFLNYIIFIYSYIYTLKKPEDEQKTKKELQRKKIRGKPKEKEGGNCAAVLCKYTLSRVVRGVDGH